MMLSLMTLLLAFSINACTDTSHKKAAGPPEALSDTFSHPHAETDTKAPGEHRRAPIGLGALSMIGQLSDGVRRIIHARDLGRWYQCGELLSDREQADMALEIVWKLLNEMEGLGVTVNPWGVLGTMYNESGFDPCALGIGPRKLAYRMSLLTPRRATKSHTAEETLSAIRDPKLKRHFKNSGYDLGLCQVLSRFHRETPLADMLSVDTGIRICVLEMQARIRHHKTRVPWRYWRGSETPWYHRKINRWVRIMKGNKL